MPGYAVVLGAAGFLGLPLVAALARHGWQVRAFDRYRTGVPAFDASHVEVCQGEFEREGDVVRALRGCDTVFHLVGTSVPERSNHDIVADLTANVVPTLRLLDLACTAGIKRVIYASSGGKVYGVPDALPIPETHRTDPQCAYGVHKLAVEKYLELYRGAHGLDYRVLRIANAFGEGQASTARQGAVAVFLGRAIRGEPMAIWGDGSVVRDYVHVSDVTRAFCLVAEYAGRHRVFNIGSGAGVSVAALVAAIERLVGRRVPRQYQPGRTYDVPVNVLDIRRAAAHLEWTPRIGFEDGLQRALAWLTVRTTTTRSPATAGS